ncbi:hypothetical protein FDECE_12832 [Fusarium decemcellulare]|nr:hypothetical protein FDECE_12832 [Fusarium decemcellulare]
MSGKVSEAFSLPLLFEPGSSWVYGAGLDWAGVLVQRINGTSLEDYMQNNLFAPLGLKSSTLRPSTRPDVSANLTQMWYRTEEGHLTPISSPYPLDARDDSGGMGLVTSTSDFVKILQDLLKEQPVLLAPDSISQMFTAQFELGTPQYEGLMKQESLHKQLTGDNTGHPEVSFGLGGLVVQSEVPNLPAGTLTWNGMPNIGWFVHRDEGLGAIYISQVLPAGDTKNVELLVTPTLRLQPTLSPPPDFVPGASHWASLWAEEWMDLCIFNIPNPLSDQRIISKSSQDVLTRRSKYEHATPCYMRRLTGDYSVFQCGSCTDIVLAINYFGSTLGFHVTSKDPEILRVRFHPLNVLTGRRLAFGLNSIQPARDGYGDADTDGKTVALLSWASGKSGTYMSHSDFSVSEVDGDMLSKGLSW